MYGNYFHYILVFSPTAGSEDDTYDALKIPQENFVKEFDPYILEMLIESRKEMIKAKGIEYVAKRSRVLIIFDDIIANRQFLHSSEALTLFSLLRHYLCSVIILIQSYTKIPRALRIQANATILFPSQRNEIEILKDELCPCSLNKKEFQKVIEHATADKHSFLYINNHSEKGKNIRKNLDQIINLDDFKK
jgi:hypothetical protein